MPSGPGCWRNVVEFRHRSWWNQRVYDAFREAGAIFCSCSGPRLPDELVRTADDVYATPQYINHTSPFIDQSQTYGSNEQVTNLLREWVLDPTTGQYIPGAALLDGHTLGTQVAA